MKIRITGCDYEVVEVDRVSRDGFTYGEVDYVEQKLTLSKEMGPHRRMETLFHEIIHCLLFNMRGISDCVRDNEAFVNMLAVMLIQVLNDNPELVSYFVKEKENV